jgi:uncharacterized metal-binding protein YceD (DUF177 family)
MSQAPDSPGAEFSRLIEVETLGADPYVRRIEATAAECEALARRFGILSLDSFAAEIEVRREPGRRVRVSGRFEAALQQRCVVSLVPVTNRVADRFEMVYTDDPAAQKASVDWEYDEELELYDDGVIDLGEEVAQQLAVRIDPYPRAPGAVVPEDFRASDAEPDTRESPFKVLSSLDRRK